MKEENLALCFAALITVYVTHSPVVTVLVVLVFIALSFAGESVRRR